MTTIALFGASGRLGQRVLLRALLQGCTVRALVRDPERVLEESRRLVVVRGDVLDPVAVARTLEGADVVVSLIGPSPGASPSLLEDTATVLLAQMELAGVRRIFTMIWVAVLDEGDQPRLADQAARLLASTLFARSLADAEEHVALVRASGTVWTVVRVPRLSEAPGEGRYRVGVMGEHGSTRISRDDLADFLVDAVIGDRYRRQLPFVTE